MKRTGFVVAFVCLASVLWGQDVFPQLATKASTAKGPVVMGSFNNVSDKRPVPMADGIWSFEMGRPMKAAAFDLSTDKDGKVIGTYLTADANLCTISGYARPDINNKKRIIRLDVECPGERMSFFGELAADGKFMSTGNFAVIPTDNLRKSTVGRFTAHML